MSKDAVISGVMLLVREELERANRKHEFFRNDHEGYAVLLEEVDELWYEIRRRNKSQTRIREEAIQVSAMAIKLIISSMTYENKMKLEKKGGTKS